MVMTVIEQGDMLRVSEIKYPVIVVSNNFFNKSGKVIVCPILKNAVEGPLHIRLRHPAVEGVVLCEQVKYLDLKARNFSKLTSTHYFDIVDISDAVMGIFDYQQL